MYICISIPFQAQPKRNSNTVHCDFLEIRSELVFWSHGQMCDRHGFKTLSGYQTCVKCEYVNWMNSCEHTSSETTIKWKPFKRLMG